MPPSHAPVAMVDQPILRTGPGGMDRLLQRIEDKTRSGLRGHFPANDPSGEGVDDEGDIDEPRPGGHLHQLHDLR